MSPVTCRVCDPVRRQHHRHVLLPPRRVSVVSPSRGRLFQGPPPVPLRCGHAAVGDGAGCWCGSVRAGHHALDPSRCGQCAGGSLPFVHVVAACFSTGMDVGVSTRKGGHFVTSSSGLSLLACVCFPPTGPRSSPQGAIRHIVYNSVVGNPTDADFPPEAPQVRAAVSEQLQVFPR
jgi:hypothetical protein